MTSRTRVLAALFASFLPFAAPCFSQAQTNVPPASDLSAKIEELQRQLEDLRTQLAALKKDSSQPATSGGTAAASTTSSSTSLAGLLGPTSLSGFVDTYYGYNANQPASRTNGFRSFDT